MLNEKGLEVGPGSLRLILSFISQNSNSYFAQKIYSFYFAQFSTLYRQYFQLRDKLQ
jgi:hypothetical protein